MSTTITEKKPIVCMQQARYDHLDFKSLMKPLGGMKTYIDKGDNVLIKPNLLNATKPEKAVVTDPRFIEAVVKAVHNAEGIPVIGDSPSGPFTKRRLQKVYEKAGLIDLSKRLGIELNYDTRSTKMQIPDAETLNKTRICNYVRNADAIIALPKIKTHSLMIMTLATKIMFGVAPGLIKARYHAQFIKKPSFADMLLDILTVIPPDLILMDGVIGMQGNGPMSGTPIPINLIAASEHSIALDIAICKTLGIEPLGIPTLKQAKIRKLWPETITYPIKNPNELQIKDFLLPSTAGHLITGEQKPNKHPVITEKCVACGECKQICPKKAITIKDGKAEINYKKCIQCYCCHEVCTYNAITLEVISALNQQRK